MNVRRIWGWIALGLLAVACGRTPHVSDTGYQGTWERGNDRVRSRMAILRDGERYLWRGTVDSEDGDFSVRCDWDGRCEETYERTKTSEYTCRVWLDAGSGSLRKECSGRILPPDEKPLHTIDELVLEPGGLKLLSRTLERDGHVYDEGARPGRDFAKVDDAVEDPPPLAAPVPAEGSS